MKLVEREIIIKEILIIIAIKINDIADESTDNKENLVIAVIAKRLRVIPYRNTIEDQAL